MVHHTILGLPAEVRITICDYLEVKDLSNFSKTCWDIKPYAREEMYRRDAATRNSSAILWAAGASGCGGEYSAMAVSMLQYSVQHGGDVNARYFMDGDATCTVIHVAAAHGSRSFVEELLRLGALIGTYSLRLWKFLNVGRFRQDLDIAGKLNAFSQRTRLQDQCWFPLMPAMFQPAPTVARLLLDSNHPCRLAIHHRHLFVPPLQRAPLINAEYTLHHLLVEQNVFPDLHKELFERFRHSITVPAASSGRLSPLMRAVQKGNESATDILLSFSQDLDAVSGLGWPVLSYAVEGASTLLVPKARDWSASLVPRLLEKGAGVNVGGPSSPLQLAVTSVVEDEIVTDPKHRKRMLAMIEVLLMHEADVNARTARGQRLGQYVFQKMQKGRDVNLLRHLFTAFLKHGMNVHEPFPDETSFLARSLSLASGATKTTVIAALLACGARPEPHECDDILRRWLLTSKDNKNSMLPKEMEEKLPELAHHFTQTAVDSAFTKLVRDKDNKHFDALVQWRQTSRPSNVLAVAIQNRFPRRDALYALPFAPAWQNKYGQGYAHLVMQGLEEGIYDEKAAVGEMRRLIKGGVSLGHRDDEGKTVLQHLSIIRRALEGEPDKPDKLERLEKLLSRRRLEEIGNEV
ncbi:ankyrin repeat-containing protein [Cordyceps fumosorosea ARSEF 2679]|uniref:Ankyrin repeat-containing protein n=1 Tax=Cordyceps fumosorosea (strain ARSEF 2679) TaxID=1081104 RepID=A0A168CPB1_CORFA|nr:ankyrin repeat-containing protein [Cordyceps fumosorosea ARSEF 2679]OAA71625.1 ankyrin repeat-containing protein [Cordyceps fumosorosea ARSEF 2679]